MKKQGTGNARQSAEAVPRKTLLVILSRVWRALRGTRSRRICGCLSAGWGENGSNPHNCAGPLLILLAAFVAVAPQLIRGSSCGHDFDFHLVSWFDCFNSWRHGILYPRWAPSPNYGAGEPRFVFYPPLTWMLGAALAFVRPWTAVPLVLTFLILAATGLAASQRCSGDRAGGSALAVRPS